ncbi:Phosphoribosylamine--glycine ligase [compost metagenome]
MLASGGYPAAYPSGLPIQGLDKVKRDGGLVFHAGTDANEAGELVTKGGRVLGVVGLGSDIADARNKAYAAAELITFEGKHNRTDIAAKALV